MLSDGPFKKRLWSPRKMKLAVEAVAAGAKLRKTSAHFGIPVTSLHDHIKKGPEYKPKLGCKPVFSFDQEAEIREELVELSKKCNGLSQQASRRAVYQYAQRNKIKHPFNKNKEEAGKDWFYGFLKRNPDVCV